MQNKINLVLASFMGLFLELSLIRWIPAHVFSIAFFSNVILIASFLGLGLGYLLSERKPDAYYIFPWFLGVFTMAILLLGNVQITLPANAQTWIWSYYQGNRLYIPIFKVPVTAILGTVFCLVVLVFIPLGQKIGKLMAGFSPLRGYSFNILGSLLGVICFGIFSFFNAPAFTWFSAAGLLAVLILYRERIFLAALSFIVIVAAIIGVSERNITWSPYYSIELSRAEDKSLAVYVNQLFHQKAVNFDKDILARDKYEFPYRWFNPGRVLIIGAGTGNDVWIALRAGARHVDAVEIDPVILNLGRKWHPQLPYNSNIVRVFTDDARSFMHRASMPYDMIVYGTLDSHATLSVTSSIRLDNYVYTRQALEEARRLLSPEGVIVLLFSVPSDWMGTRLIESVRSVFGAEETRYVFTDPYLFNLMVFAGPGLKKALLERPDLSRTLSAPSTKKGIAEIPDDDWPYLYLEKRGIPRLYLITLLMLIGISIAAVFGLSPLKGGKINLFFFLLGCAFLLLETKSITTLSLLFGSTWLVNAVVFSAILFLALAANWLVMAKRIKKTSWLFGALVLSLVVSYFFPVTSLLRLGFFYKAAAAGLVAGLPIFFAAIIFAIVFKSTKYVGIALGSNLLGAVVGGFLEYGSMALGLRALYIVALICYLMAWVYLSRGAEGGEGSLRE